MLFEEEMVLLMASVSPHRQALKSFEEVLTISPLEKLPDDSRQEAHFSEIFDHSDRIIDCSATKNVKFMISSFVSLNMILYKNWFKNLLNCNELFIIIPWASVDDIMEQINFLFVWKIFLYILWGR